MQKFEIIFSYKAKKLKYTQEANNKDSALYFFNGICIKKGMKDVSIISVTEVNENIDFLKNIFGLK